MTQQTGVCQPTITPSKTASTDRLHLLRGDKIKRGKYSKLPKRYALDIGRDACLEMVAQRYGFTVAEVAE